MALPTIEDDLAELNQLARPDFDPATMAILDTAAPPVAPAARAEAAPAVTYTPNQAQVRASVSAPAILVLSDAYSDGWRASVDGQATTLYRVNYALRGVWLASGEHTIVFTYCPRAFLVGGGISLATALGLLVYGCWAWWRMRRQRVTR